VELRANAKAEIWGIFLTMDRQKLIPPSPFPKTSKNSTIGEEEQLREFSRQGLGIRKICRSGIFGKFPGRARRLTKNPPNSGKFLFFDCRDDNLEKGERPCQTVATSNVSHDIAEEREEEERLPGTMIV